MTLLNKTHTHRKKEKKLVHDSSSISITASVSTASDIHLTQSDTCHNKDAQNTTTAIPREGVLVERQSKTKTTKKKEPTTTTRIHQQETDAAAGKSFLS